MQTALSGLKKLCSVDGVDRHSTQQTEGSINRQWSSGCAFKLLKKTEISGIVPPRQKAEWGRRCGVWDVFCLSLGTSASNAAHLAPLMTPCWSRPAA